MIELRVLGPIEVTGPDGPVDLGGPMQRRLLGILVARANTLVPTEQLIDALWEGQPPQGARRSFKAYIARLRGAIRALDVDPVVTHHGGYALEVDADTIDAVRFENLTARARAELTLGETQATLDLIDEALALWRGAPFDEFAGEEWHEAWTSGLDATHADAHELRLEALLMTGSDADLLPRIEPLVARHPYRDGLRGIRARALYKAGRHVDALQELQAYRARLIDELGVEPGPELAALEQRILAHDPDLSLTGTRRRSLHDYELLERVGADATSVVHRAMQRSLGREVAVRTVRPTVADDPEFVRRFEAEAQREAAIDHPHIAAVHDFWREPGAAHVVTRWLDGDSLRSQLERHGPLPPDDALRITGQIGDALGTAHRVGLAHGAIDAGAIRLDHDGRAALTDLRLVDRALCGRTPEAVRDDVRALGRLLHELIVGAPPTSDAERWEPALLRSDLRPELDTVIRRACAHEPDFADATELTTALRTAIATEDGGPGWVESSGAPVPNPYKGLRPFVESDAGDFFGRDRLVEHLHDRVETSPFVAVVGPSGSGKSSVIRAGLVPRLRAGGAYVAVMRPGARPFDELRRALLAVAPGSAAGRTATPTPWGVARTIRDLVATDAPLVIVVDQLEELYTAADPASRDAFATALAEIAADPGNPARLLVAVRADFYGLPLVHPALGPLLRDHSVVVTPLGGDELEAAITGPAARAGVRFEPGLVAMLVAEAAREPATLPILQFVLTELFDRRRGRTITEADYAELGGMSGILARHAETVFEDLGPSLAGAVEHLFTRLVTPGEGTDDTRRRAPVGELGDVPAIVVDAYTDARLISHDRDSSTREPTIELAHEALLLAWPRLRRWIDDDRDALRAIVNLERAAAAWDAGGRDPDDLYRGVRLAGAVELQQRVDHPPGPLASSFVEASADAAAADDRRRARTTRRLRTSLAVAVVALLVASIAVVLAVQRGREASDRADDAQEQTLIAREQARRTEIGALMTAATTAVGEDPQLAALLAIEGWRLDGDEAGRDILLRALADDTRRIATLPTRIGPVTDVAVSGDGNVLAIGDGGAIEVFDLAALAAIGGVQHVPSEAPLPGNNLAIDDDGGLIATIVQDDPWVGGDEVLVVETNSGERTRRPIPTPGARDGGRNAVFELTPEIWPGSDVFFVPGTGETVTTDMVTSAWWTNGRQDVTQLDARVVAVSANGDWVATSEGANRIDVHPADDLSSSETVDLTEVRPPDTVFRDVLVTSDGRHVVVRWADEVTIHPVGDDLPPLAAGVDRIPVPSGVTSMAIGPDDELAIASTFGTVELFDTGTARLIGRPLAVEASGTQFANAGGLVVEFIPGTGLVTAGDVVTIWALAGDSALATSPLPGGRGVAVSPDGDLVATTTHDCRVFISDADDGTPTAEGVIPDTPIETPVIIEFSPDGRLLAIGGGQGSCTENDTSGTFGTGLLHLLDASTGATVATLRREARAHITALDWHPDGTSLAVGHWWGRVEHLSVPSLDTIGEPLELTPDWAVPVSGVSFDPTGDRLIAALHDGDLVHIDASSGAIESRVGVAGQIGRLEILDDGRLMTTANDGAIQVRDLDGDAIGAPVDAHELLILSIAVGDDRVLTSSLDSIQEWTVEPLAPLGPPIPGAEVFLAMSVDGDRLAVTSDGAAGIWSLDPDDWIDRACDIAGRNLTPDEWERHLPDGEPYRTTCPQWPSDADVD